MTAQSIVCGACAAEVPNGRLSCPSCGELLASVSGSRRAGGSAASVAASAVVPPVLYDPATAPTGSVVDGQLSLEPSERDAESGSSRAGSTQTQAAGGALKATVNDGAAAEGLLDDDDDATGLPAWTPPSSTVPWGTASDLNGGRTPAYMPRPGLRPSPPQPTVAATADPYPADDAPAWTGLGSEPAVLTDPEPVPPTHPGTAPVAKPQVSWPASGPASPARGPVAWPEPGAAAAMAAALSVSPAPTAVPAPPAPTAVPAALAVQVPQAAQPFDGPGAYLPPVPVTLPAGPSAPAREWAGHTPEATGNDAEAVPQTRSADRR